MPVSFSSPPRNLFLLGSSGADVVTNFFKKFNLSSLTDDRFLPDEIRHLGDDNYINAGTAQDSNSKEFGWVRKDSYVDPTLSNLLDVKFQSSISGVDTNIRALEVDQSGDGIVVVGKTGSVPWIAKLTKSAVDTNTANIQWQSTSNTAGVEYTGVTVSGGSYYACGSTPTGGSAEAFVEKYDSSGNPGWGKGAYNLGRDVTLRKIAALPNGNVIAVGQIEDDESFKGYIVKLDTVTGEVLWDRTIQSFEDSPITKYEVVYPESVHIDGNGDTYVVGRLIKSLLITRGFIIKYSPEGNILWQKETPLDKYFEFIDVKSDTDTKQSIVFGRYYDSFANDWSGVLSKYSEDGSLVWRRTLTSSVGGSNSFGNQFKVNLDADPSFYYLLFVDQDLDNTNGTPDSYTFGKVSSSGNGLGDFQYYDGTGETIDYEILSITDREGRLQDGSVSLELSSMISSPFNANKIMFDDYATNISNKKRQMETAGNFQYSGSPAVRIGTSRADLNLLGDVYSGSGNWLDQSGKGNDGVTSYTTTAEEPFFGAGSISFDGNSDSLTFTTSSDLSLDGDFTIEFYIYNNTIIQDTQHPSPITMPTDGTAPSQIYTQSTNDYYGLYKSGDIVTTGNNSALTGVWQHVAFTRSGSTCYAFLDGVLKNTATSSATFGGTSGTYRIGSYTGSGGDVDGYISNLRILKGTALYTSNFTPPTSPLTAIANTVLLTAQGSSITDASSNNFAITVNGDPIAAVSSTSVVSYNSAGYFEFNGTDDYIDITSIDPIADTSAVTMEAWIFADNLTNTYQVIGTWERQTQHWQLTYSGDTNYGLSFAVSGTGDSVGITGTPNITQWKHIVATWNGGSLTTLSDWAIYVNGVKQTIQLTGATGTAGNGSYIGTREGFAASNFFDGKIAEVRYYSRALSEAEVYQNYNATRSKYLGEAFTTSPNIIPGVITNNLHTYYDFGNRHCFDPACNFIGWSEDFTLTGTGRWLTYGDLPAANVTSNYAQDPFNNGMTATKVVNTDPSVSKSLKWNPAVNGNGDKAGPGAHWTAGQFTLSIYAKAISDSCFLRLNSYDNSSNRGVTFNVATGTFNSTPASAPDAYWIEEIGNGWYRFSITVTSYIVSSSYDNDYQLIIPPGNEMLIFGAQMSVGSRPERYIRTDSDASAFHIGVVPNQYVYNLTAQTAYDRLVNDRGLISMIGYPYPESAGYLRMLGEDSAMDIGTVSGGVGGANGWTLEVWIRLYKLQDNANEWNYFLRDDASSTPNWEIGVYDNDNYIWRFKENVSTNEHSFTMTQNEWYYVAMQCDSSKNFSMTYLDGSSLTSTGTLLGNGGSNAGILFDHFFNRENFASSQNRLAADCGEIRLYENLLSAAEITQNFNATRGKYDV